MVAILAGIRGYTVGTDVQVYGNDLFYYARTVSWSQFYHSLTKIEPLYLLLVYFSSRFSSEPHIQYFFIGLIIYTFVMAGIVKIKGIYLSHLHGSLFCVCCMEILIMQ